MSRFTKQRVQPRRGAAAVSMVLVLVLVSLVITGMVLGGARDHNLTVRRLETVQAFYAAEGGMNMAIREMVQDVDEDGDGTVGTISDDGNESNNPTLGAADVFVQQSANSGDTQLVSRGGSGQSSRQVKVTLTGGGGSPGLNASYFHESCCLSRLSDVNWTRSPDNTATVTVINFGGTYGPLWPGGPNDYFGAQYTGTIDIPQDGSWTFYTNSDDGSKLWIDGQLVVNNDGLHSMRTRSGTVNLTAGKHDITIRVFENWGAVGLIVYWQGPGVPNQTPIPASAFSH